MNETDMTTDGMRIVSGDVSCENCVHFPVCAIYKGFAPMIEQNWPGDEPPIAPTELAVICDEYTEER